MSTQHLIEQLRELRLPGFVNALEQQLQQPNTYNELGFSDRLALLVNQESTSHHNKKIERLVKQAKLRLNAQLSDIDYSPKRGLRKDTLSQLAQTEWIERHRNLLVVGPTGTGKTFLVNALARHYCEHGISVRYYRVKRLFDALAITHGDGTYGKWLTQISKTDVLILDDWGLEGLTQSQRNDLLEIMDDRHNAKSTIVASQLPIEHWHDVVGDPTLADAILDRLIHNAYKLKLSGESMRKKDVAVDLA